MFKLTRSGEVYQELSGRAQAMEPGDKMPSYKALIDELGVSQGAIDSAYSRLRAQGVVESRSKSGTYIANPFADGIVVYICSTVHFMPAQGAAARQLYMALRQALPAFFPGASLDLQVVDYDPLSGVREGRICDLLSSLLERYRVLGAVSFFRLDCEETYQYCAQNRVPLIDVGHEPGTHCYTVHTGNQDYVWGLGLDHLREQGWDDRMLVVAHIADRGACPDEASEERIRRQAARLDPEVRCECVHVPIGADVEDAGADFVKQLLRRAEGLPGAMVVSDDCLLRGMITGALEEGVKLAEVCPLVAISNEGIPIRASRELTRVEYRHQAVAREQLKILADLLQGNLDCRPAPVPPALIIGKSSRHEDYVNPVSWLAQEDTESACLRIVQ